MEKKQINSSNTSDYMGTDLVNPLLTDFYQFSMAYAHWKNGRCNDKAIFDLYFRKCPFNAKFCIFGGLDECLEFIRNYKFTEKHIKYLRTQFPQAEEEFFQYLSNIDMSDINVYGFLNSEYVLPNEPLLTLEGPLVKVQILESTLLNLTNYPTLISSLAHRLRSIKGLEDKIFVEDGCKHAQTANGALMGVKYSTIGGVDQSTFLLASKIFDLNLFHKTSKIDEEIDITTFGLTEEDFIYEGRNLIENIIQKIPKESYEKVKSLLWKRLYPLILSISLKQFAYEICSGENIDEEMYLFALCCIAVKDLNIVEDYFFLTNYLDSFSNITEINSKLTKTFKEFGLDRQKCKILIRYNPSILQDSSNCKIDFEHFGGLILGTEFTVSQTHPALGMVYKITEINNKPCLKFSEEKEKQTIPGNKKVIRLFDENSNIISDVLCLKDEAKSIMDSNEIEVFLYNEFTQKYKLKYHQSKIMNTKIFSKGKTLCKFEQANELKKKVAENYKNFKQTKEINLYISLRIRDIILEETKKLRE